jgi:hypothetical protein
VRSAVLPRIRPDKSCRGPPLRTTVLTWSLACIRVSEKLSAKHQRRNKAYTLCESRRTYRLFIFDALTVIPWAEPPARPRSSTQQYIALPSPQSFFFCTFFFYTPTISSTSTSAIVSDFTCVASNRTFLPSFFLQSSSNSTRSVFSVATSFAIPIRLHHLTSLPS